MGLVSAVWGELVDAFLRVYGEDLAALVLFGSYARGEERSDSDIDLLVVLRSIGDRYEAVRRIRLVEGLLEGTLFKELRARGLNPSISPIFLSVDQAARFRPLYIDAVFDAKVLYDRDGVVAKTLERVKRRLEELGAVRLRLGRTRYVVLTKVKPGEVIRFE